LLDVRVCFVVAIELRAVDVPRHIDWSQSAQSLRLASFGAAIEFGHFVAFHEECCHAMDYLSFASDFFFVADHSSRRIGFVLLV